MARTGVIDAGSGHRSQEKKRALIAKVHIDLETTHVLQDNAFADTLGKRCSICGRHMKLQWKRDLAVAAPRDFFWGCTGWYVQKSNGKACTNTEPMKASEYGLMTDLSQPEFAMTADEFGIILSEPSTERILAERIDDLKADLSKSCRGVELVTCPVHAENMLLKTKRGVNGAPALLDAYFLACPHWLPHDKGCTFMEKLKSGSQLAAL